MTTKTEVKVGQRYIGWGKTFEVTKVWRREGVVDAQCVAGGMGTIRWPLKQFRQLPPA